MRWSSLHREGDPYTPDLFARQCDACLAHDTLDRLREISHRTLDASAGATTRSLRRACTAELADEIPRADLVTLASGAHLVMAESARAFNDVVLRFLTSR